MAVEIRFPLELIVEGAPISAGASAVSRRRWQQRLASAARSQLQPGAWLTTGPVAVTILHFSDASMTGDIDNTIKPILDSFSGVVYIDDRQVERLLVQKFEPRRPVSFELTTSLLLSCAAMTGLRTYVRIDDDLSRELDHASR